MPQTIFKCIIILFTLICIAVSGPQSSKSPPKQKLKTWEIVYIIIGIVLVICTFLLYKLYKNGTIRRLYERCFNKIEEVEFVNVGSEAQNF